MTLSSRRSSIPRRCLAGPQSIAPRLFNITVTNVPGPQLSLYALGSQLRRILPLVPLFAGHAVGMAIVSYDGELVFGINADYATTPDLDVLEAALHEEFAQLLEIARGADRQLRAAGARERQPQ